MTLLHQLTVLIQPNDTCTLIQYITIFNYTLKDNSYLHIAPILTI